MAASARLLRLAESLARQAVALVASGGAAGQGLARGGGRARLCQRACLMLVEPCCCQWSSVPGGLLPPGLCLSSAPS